MMLSDVCLTSDVCRVHPVGGRRVRPAGLLDSAYWLIGPSSAGLAQRGGFFTVRHISMSTSASVACRRTQRQQQSGRREATRDSDYWRRNCLALLGLSQLPVSGSGIQSVLRRLKGYHETKHYPTHLILKFIKIQPIFLLC